MLCSSTLRCSGVSMQIKASLAASQCGNGSLKLDAEANEYPQSIELDAFNEQTSVQSHSMVA